MNSLKYSIKKEWYNLILLILSFLAIPFIWDRLPEQIPSHWNLQGEIDGYVSKGLGLFFLPSLAVITYLILLYLPVIDPKKRIEIDQKPIPILRTLFVVLILGIHCWIITLAMNLSVNSQSWILLGLASFFLLIGNYLKTIQPNYFIGIRVPWALEDPVNWKKTHHLGSYIWVAGGLILIILFPIVNQQIYTVLFGIVAALMAVIPAIYSFWLYKQS